VLTTTQLVRLTGEPERTVQYRLGASYHGGLVSRHRPAAAIGTCPHHWWLTAFGAAAIGAGTPQPWSEDLAAVRTVASLSDLWLDLKEHGPEVNLTLTTWRRLPDGFSYRDPRTGADRRLAVDAELGVRFGDIDVRALVFARIDRVPRARLSSVVARWADFLAPPPCATPARRPVAALVLTRNEHQGEAVLTAALAPAAPAVWVAVGRIEACGGALATAAVWRSPADDHDWHLVDLLAGVVEAVK
jgi:hypothetical protein